MPIYRFRCPACGAERDEYRRVSDRDRMTLCKPKCNDDWNFEPNEAAVMERVVAAPMVMTDMQPYQSMIDGSWITSRSQHRTHLRDHNCIEIGNETKYLKPKEKIDLAPESKAARKQKIIEQVNALK